MPAFSWLECLTDLFLHGGEEGADPMAKTCGLYITPIFKWGNKEILHVSNVGWMWTSNKKRHLREVIDSHPIGELAPTPLIRVGNRTLAYSAL